MLRRSPAAFVLSCFILLAGVAPAFAQEQKPKYWGVEFSYTPTWKADRTMQDMLYIEGDPLLEGTEFTFGVARGSALGGNWGVSYVRKSINDGSTVTFSEQQSGPNFAFSSTETSVMQKVFLQGVEVYTFIPFVNIKNRVQIGVNVGGGIASVKGTIHQTRDTSNTFIPSVGPPQTTFEHEEETLPASEVILSLQPLGRVEAMAAFIIVPGLKAKISAGFNMPSAIAFRIGAVYLIGAK